MKSAAPLLACALLSGCIFHVRGTRTSTSTPVPSTAPAPAAASTRAWPASAAAPAPVGPYSQAVRAGDTLWLSGQIGLDPATGALVEGGVAAQTERALANLGAVLDAAGLTFEDVVEVQVFLTDLGQFATMNAVYAQRFRERAPARTSVGVSALPLGAAVEIRAVASYAR